MARFRNYEDRQKTRTTLRLGFLGVVGAGIFALRTPRGQQAVASLVSKQLSSLGRLAERNGGRGFLSKVVSKVEDIRSLNIRNNRVVSALESFGRLVEYDLPQERQRAAAVAHLVTSLPGISQENAELLFRQSNVHYDLLRVPASEALAQPYYRKHVLDKVRPNLQSANITDNQFLAAVEKAREAAISARRDTPDDKLHDANEAIRRFIYKNVVKGRGRSRDSAVKQVTLGELVDESFIGRVERSLSTASSVSGISNQRAAFFRSLEEEATLNTAQRTYAQAAYALWAHRSKGNVWRRAGSIGLDIVKNEEYALNVDPIAKAVSSVFSRVADEFQIPIAPGLKGFQPLKLMPWLRGRTKDFAGTLSAGTRQREVYEALKAAGVAENYFDENFILKKDLHFIGDKILGIDGTWQIKDARSGFLRDVAQVRNAGNAEGSPGLIRSWFGDSTIGRLMDVLGLDRQGTPSIFSEIGSVVGKFLFPNAERYRSHPLNALRRIMGGSNSVDDIEAVLFATSRHSTNPGKIPITEIFSEDILDRMHPGFKALVQGGMTAEDMGSALLEIDAIMSGADSTNFRFFKDIGAQAFRGRHTKISARRFAQNAEEFLSEGLSLDTKPGAVNLEGILGEPNKIFGEDKLKAIFYDELMQQIVDIPGDARTDVVRSLFRNIANSGNLSAEESSELFLNAWSKFQQKSLHSSYIDQPTFAESIAEELRNFSSSFGISIEDQIRKTHPTFSTWVNPNTTELEGTSSILYAVPEYVNPVKNQIRSVYNATMEFTSKGTGSFTERLSRAWGHLKGLTRETNSTEYGDAVHPGFLYHSAYRLNSMLAGFGLGLPERDTQTAVSTFKNLLIKRVLPAYAAVEAYRYADFESEETTGVGITEGLSNIRANYNVATAKIADVTGFTKYSKKIVSLLPGIEQYFNPRSYKEQIDYLTKGYEPVRRGRGWLLGSRTPILGDKISYWAPSWYQQQVSNWSMAPNVDQNTEAYWAHSWLPTPRYPLSPLFRLLDPYWFEERHSEGPNADRPYPYSSSFADPNTIWGSVLNTTIGRILKPRIRLKNKPNEDTQQEYGGVSASNKTFAMFSPAGKVGLYTRGGGEGTEILSDGSGSAKASSYPTGRGYSSGGGGSSSSGVAINDIPIQGTSSGAIGTNDGSQIQPVNWRRLPRGQSAAYARNYVNFAQLYRPEKSATEDIDPINTSDSEILTKRTDKQIEDILGLYGFMAMSAADRFNLFDDSIETPVYATADLATSPERRWYDRELGGLGGELNELFRRFLPHRDRNIKYVNEIPNNMPGWMPGKGALVNLKEGDPYIQYKMGEARLPGEAFERINKDTMLPLFRTRGSSLGKTVEEIARGMLNERNELTEFEEYVTEYGTEQHRKIQKALAQKGYIEAYENRVVDQENNISGHFDAILNINNKRIVADIKTVGGKKFKKGGIHPEHRTQLNFYMKQLGIDTAQLYYVNRDNPEDDPKVYTFRFSQALYDESIRKVKQAKAMVVDMINSGQVSRGELYDEVTRAEILAGTQPWSSEYKVALAQAREAIAGEDDPVFKQALQERLNIAVKQGAQQKKLYHIYNYKFNQPLERKTYTIDRIIDASTFKVKESPRPVRLAAVSISGERIREWMKANNRRVADGESVLDAFYRSHGIYRGAKIDVLQSENIADDQLRTIRASVTARGRNLNKLLLQEGIGIEKEDWSAAGVNIRFNSVERFIGRTWESITHMDLPWNKKFINTFSALELYKREQVYGTVSGDWAAPWSTYVVPTLDSFAGKHPLAAIFMGGLFGSLFARSMKGKLIGATIGATIAAFDSFDSTVGRLFGHTPIPRRVQKRREIEEYYDMLKYIKYKRLEKQYTELAKNDGPKDVKEIINSQTARARFFKRKLQRLKLAKRKIRMSKTLSREEKNKALDRINTYIAGMEKKNKAAYPISKNMAIALLYRDKAKRTLYGSDGKNLGDIISAIPRYERELILDVVQHGSKKEKQELFNLLSNRQKSALGRYLGVDKNRIPAKEKIEEYFKTHTLPDASWVGWSEDFNLDYARVIAAEQEGVNPIEMGIYPRNRLDAKLATEDVPIPTVMGRTENIRNVIQSLLGAHGLEDIQVDIQVSRGPKSQSKFDVEIEHDRTNDILRSIDNDLPRLMNL